MVVWVLLMHGFFQSFVSAEDSGLGPKGEQLYLEGKHADALKKFEEGWKTKNDTRCLRGMGAVHMKEGNYRALAQIASDLLDNANGDARMVALAYVAALSQKDKNLFVLCLSKTPKKMINENPDLAKQIAITAKDILVEETGKPKKDGE